MLDAVLLDWEGVLADTRDARCNALARAFADEGVRLDDEDVAMHGDGTPSPATITALLATAGRSDPTLADLISLRAARGFAERLGKGFVIAPGAREMVQHVRVNVPVAIVTRATRSETEFVLRLADLDGSITTVVSVDDSANWESGDAHRQAVARLERRRPVQSQRVVVLAQSSTALQAARHAGLRSVAIGAPAHVALHADGAADRVNGLTIADIARLAGIAAVEQQS